MKNAEILLLPGKAGSRSLKVILKGDLSIKNVGEISDKILDNIKEINSLEIQTEDVSSFDLTVYQLMISLKKLFQQKGKEISFFLNIPESCEDLMKNAGLDINLN